MRSTSRSNIPSSRARILCRISPADISWAGVSPILAFLIRDGAINQPDGTLIYCAVALTASIIAFQWFRISSPIVEFFSFHDALVVTKACLTTVALTAVVLFVFTRLVDAPRSVPIIHFLLLVAGLIGVRAFLRFRATHNAEAAYQSRLEEIENILIVGATRPARFFISMIEEFAAANSRIIAILDERPSRHNRKLNGYSVVGSPANLSKVVDEYAVHGIGIHKVVMAVHPQDLAGAIWIDICETCSSRSIPIEWLHEKYSFGDRDKPATETALEARIEGSNFSSRPYWELKRVFDLFFAVLMIIVLAPLFLMVAALVWIDVGVPMVFWQERIGRFGRPLHIYKFRTMRSSVDKGARPVEESMRLSILGRQLRRSRLDELPQLFNILTGSMSLIGPRPLLPIDQPKNRELRLSIRPGITGLAQINGGTLLSPEEKDALDEWYVQNATLLLDIRILLLTALVILRGERRNEEEIEKAVISRRGRLEAAIESQG